MKTSAVLALIYQLALPGYHYEFPRDYFSHPEYRTEWWYYTGNLQARDGHRFGFELTFFRQAVQRDLSKPNVWDVEDIWLAHLALSDIDAGRFYHTERFNRAGAGLAGADAAQRRVWNGNWQVQWVDGIERLQAVTADFEFRLDAKSTKPPAGHGINGIIQKSAGTGNASHYFSETHLATHGTIRLHGQTYDTSGVAWMDHEFFSHDSSSDEMRWDWFSLQLDDRSEVMLYRLRRKDGSPEPYSSGTYIDRQGRTRHLALTDFQLTPGKTWQSPATGARYPIQWRIQIPSLALDLELSTRLPQQEMTSENKASPSYWEGAIEVGGSRRGAGYLEMTGYAGGVNFGG